MKVSKKYLILIRKQKHWTQHMLQESLVHIAIELSVDMTWNRRIFFDMWTPSTA